MPAKLLIFITMLVFSSDVFAEYYLVYPIANVSCDQPIHKVKHRKHVAYKKRTHKVVYRKRSSYRVVKYHRPCAGVVRCSACGEYVQTTCGSPDYIVYSAQSSDCNCLTYEGVLDGEE